MSKVTQIYQKVFEDSLASKGIHVNKELLFGLFSYAGELNPDIMLEKLAEVFNSAFSTWKDITLPDGTKGDLIYLKDIAFIHPKKGFRLSTKDGGKTLIYDIRDRTVLPVQITVGVYGGNDIIKRLMVPAMISGGGNTLRIKTHRQIVPVLTDNDIAVYKESVKNPLTGKYENTAKMFIRFPKDKIQIARAALGIDITITTKGGITTTSRRSTNMNYMFVKKKANAHTQPASACEFTDKVVLPLFGIVASRYGIKALDILLDGRKWLIYKDIKKVPKKELKNYIWYSLPSIPIGCKNITKPSTTTIGIENSDKDAVNYATSIAGALYFLAHFENLNLKDLDRDTGMVLFARIFRSKKARALATNETFIKLRNYDTYLSVAWLTKIRKQIKGAFDDLVPNEPSGFAKLIAILDRKSEWFISASSIQKYQGSNRLVVFTELLYTALASKINTQMLTLMPDSNGELPSPSKISAVLNRAFGIKAFYRHNPVLENTPTGTDCRLVKGAMLAKVQSNEGGSSATDKAAGGGSHNALTELTASTCLSYSPHLETSSMVYLNPFIRLDEDFMIAPNGDDIKALAPINKVLGNQLGSIPKEFRGEADFSAIDDLTK